MCFFAKILLILISVNGFVLENPKNWGDSVDQVTGPKVHIKIGRHDT